MLRCNAFDTFFNHFKSRKHEKILVQFSWKNPFYVHRVEETDLICCIKPIINRKEESFQSLKHSFDINYC